MIWIFRKTQWIALFAADLDLTPKHIIEHYGTGWKTESGFFTEIKHDIDSNKSQTRNAHAIMNHINSSMTAAAITWIYGTQLLAILERRYKVRGHNSFAFSDLTRITA
jgi:hypothetical protein